MLVDGHGGPAPRVAVTTHSLDLATARDDHSTPAFVPLPPRPLDAAAGYGASNGEYAELFTAMLQSPAGSNATADAQFDAFFTHFKGGYHGKRLACDAAEDEFQQCATCVGGCRASFVCLMLAGRTRAEHEACVRRYTPAR